jgi:hypothetical protein
MTETISLTVQIGFRKGRLQKGWILITRESVKKRREHSLKMLLFFVDYEKAFAYILKANFGK